MGCGALFQTVAEANVSTELQSKMAATLKLLTQVRIIVASYLSVAFIPLTRRAHSKQKKNICGVSLSNQPL